MRVATALGWIGVSPVDEVKLIADAELPRMRDGRVDEHALSMMRERRPILCCPPAVRALEAGRVRDAFYRGCARRALGICARSATR